MSLMRAFTTVHYTNKAKEYHIHNLLLAYRDACTKISSIQWKIFYQNGYFDNRSPEIKSLDTPLSQRYRQTAQDQVVSMLNSYLSNRKNDFEKKVNELTLTKEQRKILFFINKHNGWFFKEGTYKKKPILTELLQLAKHLIKDIFDRNHRPTFSHINMNLDDKVAQVRENDGTSSFDYWIRLSTLESGHPVSLPLNTHEFFEQTPGELKKFCQINFKNDNEISISLIKECPQLEYTPLTDKIGLDFGLRVLFADDQGNLFGRDIIDILRYYDNELIEITKYQNKLGLSVKTHRYNTIVKYIRDLLKQEVCRAINRIIAIHAPKEIVVEDIDFSNTDLSHQMNRILRNCGRSVVKVKLEQVEKELGIKITKENPAYSSQVCTRCGYVDKGNRPSQGEFKCKACEHTLNADVKSARELKIRSSCLNKDGEHPYDCNKSRKSVLYYIIQESFKTMNDHVEKQQGCYSTSRVQTLMCESVYYRGWCSRLKDRVLEKVEECSGVRTQGLSRKKEKRCSSKRGRY